MRTSLMFLMQCFNMQVLIFNLIFVLYFSHCRGYTNECVVPGATNRQADYYWRDYLGIVPADAVKGGFDEAGNVTYIGQILFGDSQSNLPAVIYPGKREAVSCALGGRVSSDKYVKILCSPKEFEWKHVAVHEIHHLADYHIVVGGFEAGDKLFIGRANYEDQILTGKVFPDHNKYPGLKLFSRSGSEITLLSFDLLVFVR